MRLKYALWLLVAVKLLIFPVPWIESAVSIIPASEKGLTETKVKTQKSDWNQTVAKNPGEELFEQNKKAEDLVFMAGQEATEKVSDHERSWKKYTMILGIIELMGSAIFAVVWIGYNLKFRSYLRKHRSRLSCELYYGKKLPVYVVDHLPSPCLYGKAIYVTEECVEDERKLRHVMAHEYSHERQGDRLWSVVRGLCLVFYWWQFWWL